MSTLRMAGEQLADSRPADSGPMYLTPSTLSQAALFFAECKATVGGVYNFATTLTVRGPVADDDLVAACHRVTAATPALRLRFGIEDTGEVGYWFSTEPPTVELVAPGADCVRRTESATREPFEVEEGPLVRFLVLRQSPTNATVVMVTHHLCVDGVAHARLVARLADAVAGPLRPDTEAAYDDLVRHVRQAEREARRTDLAYWSDRVPPDLLSTSRLPCDGDPAREPGRSLLRLGPVSSAAGPGASTFLTVVAAVHRALPPADAARTVVCVAASQRRPESWDGHVIGSFVNQVPLIADRAPTDSAEDIVARHAQQWSADLRRRNFPFIDLAGRVQATGPPPTLDSVMVGYRRSDRHVTRRHGDVVCEADLYYTYPLAKTELSVRFFDYAAQLECEVQHGGYLPDDAAASFVARLGREWDHRE